MNSFVQVLARELGVKESLLVSALMRTLLAWAFEQENAIRFQKSSEPLSFADLCLDPGTRTVRRGERTIHLDRVEFEILALFMRHPNQVLPDDLIIREIWNSDVSGKSTVKSYISVIRAKLEAGGEPRLLQNVWGVGYVLREDE